MGLPAIVASALSGFVAVATWVSHQVRSLAAPPRSWNCLACHVPNELSRDTCWSCGAGYGEDPLYASHIPFDRRWICPVCAVWNGIARTACWRCGTVRDGGLSSQGR